MRKVVANTTPLIALANIGQLDLLKHLYGEVVVPEAVIAEIESEPAKSLVNSAAWIKSKSVWHSERKDLFSSRLHAGEIEVILVAEEEKADLLIMDDNTAKKTAKFLGYHVTGSLGILVKAKQNGLIDAVGPFVDMLIDDGLYVDQKTKDIVLQMAGENSKKTSDAGIKPLSETESLAQIDSALAQADRGEVRDAGDFEVEFDAELKAAYTEKKKNRNNKL